MDLPAFKDHFSRDSAAYASFRPTYPDALFAWLAERSPRSGTAWDAGTGSGQAARGLAARFDRVVATDPSEAQLGQAPRAPNVEYRLGRAERVDLLDRSVDLVTAAQALHWFDRPAFWAEARRVLRPDGLIAVWGYALLRVDPSIDPVLEELSEVTVGPFWPPERKFLDEGYRTIEFPFVEVAPPPFSMSADWTLAELGGYLGTWSAVARYRTEVGRDPVAPAIRSLEPLWGGSSVRRRIEWPFHIRAGRPNALEKRA